MRNISSLSVLLGVLVSISGHADSSDRPSSANTGVDASESFSKVVLAGQSTANSQQALTIKIVNSCFGTNLRNVGNPLSPTSTIELNLLMSDKGTTKTLSLSYPASIVTNTAPEVVVPVTVALDAGFSAMSAVAAGKVVRITIPYTFDDMIDAKGNLTENPQIFLTNFNYQQILSTLPNFFNPYMGKNGPLAPKSEVKKSRDGKQIEVFANFPGNRGFCGSYVSPLVMIFGEQQPEYTAKVDFPLNPTGKTYWPEKMDGVALLAFDRNKDGKISEREELFGNIDDKFENGFEALREFDSNKDGVIDKNDKDFNKLVLWFDNGDGVSKKKELVPLSQKVKSISLKYDGSNTMAFGERAEARQISSFEEKSKGNTKTGRIVDVWFTAVKHQ